MSTRVPEGLRLGWRVSASKGGRLYLKTALCVCSLSSPLTRHEKRPKDSVPERRKQRGRLGSCWKPGCSPLPVARWCVWGWRQSSLPSPLPAPGGARESPHPGAG